MDDSFELACEFIRETDNAILIKDPLNNTEHWIPISQMISRTVDKNGFGTIEMTAWIARKKGIYK